MTNRLRIALWQLLFCLCFLAFAKAAVAARVHDKRHLEFVLILTRHGVRAPGATAESLQRYSVDRWPQWPVPPDYLTDHGYKLIEQFGSWDHKWLTSAGLLSSSGCSASAVYIYTDSDERTIRSGEALARGISPSCAIKVHSLPEGADDPLFHFLPTDRDSATRAHIIAAVQDRLPGGPNALTARYRRQLALLQSILDGCEPGAPCTKGKKQPEVHLEDIPSRIEPKKSHGLISFKGPVFTGAGLAENMLLEYVQGLPRDEVAWGRMNASQLREIIDLHTAAFSIRHRTPALARVQMSNLLDHVLLTIQQAVQGRTVQGAFGPAGKKLVIVDGHDTDISAIAGLLHVHWRLDGRTDDTPPGTQLQFLVFRDARGQASIKLRVVMQTLDQMRYARLLTPSNPPASASLNPPACTMKAQACPWESFAKVTKEAVDSQFVVALQH